MLVCLFNLTENKVKRSALYSQCTFTDEPPFHHRLKANCIQTMSSFSSVWECWKANSCSVNLVSCSQLEMNPVWKHPDIECQTVRISPRGFWALVCLPLVSPQHLPLLIWTGLENLSLLCQVGTVREFIGVFFKTHTSL